jgi:hypothetical protein
VEIPSYFFVLLLNLNSQDKMSISSTSMVTIALLVAVLPIEIVLSSSAQPQAGEMYAGEGNVLIRREMITATTRTTTTITGTTTTTTTITGTTTTITGTTTTIKALPISARATFWLDTGDQGVITKVTTGTCAENNQVPVYDAQKCTDAAAATGHGITWGPNGGYKNVVDGCSVRSGTMLFLEKAAQCDTAAYPWEGSLASACKCTPWQPCLCTSAMKLDLSFSFMGGVYGCPSLAFSIDEQDRFTLPDLEVEDSCIHQTLRKATIDPYRFTITYRQPSTSPHVFYCALFRLAPWRVCFFTGGRGRVRAYACEEGGGVEWLGHMCIGGKGNDCAVCTENTSFG